VKRKQIVCKSSRSPRGSESLLAGESGGGDSDSPLAPLVVAVSVSKVVVPETGRVGEAGLSLGVSKLSRFISSFSSKSKRSRDFRAASTFGAGDLSESNCSSDTSLSGDFSSLGIVS
jgi:hypothetical protein